MRNCANEQLQVHESLQIVNIVKCSLYYVLFIWFAIKSISQIMEDIKICFLNLKNVERKKISLDIKLISNIHVFLAMIELNK